MDVTARNATLVPFPLPHSAGSVIIAAIAATSMTALAGVRFAFSFAHRR